MRNTVEALQAFETTVAVYLNELGHLELEELHIKPNEEEWSIGQMYMHLIQSAQYMHLRNVDQCLAGNETAVESPGEKRREARRYSSLEVFLLSGYEFRRLRSTRRSSRRAKSS